MAAPRARYLRPVRGRRRSERKAAALNSAQRRRPRTAIFAAARVAARRRRAGSNRLYWPGKLNPRIVDEPLDMVDVMPTVLALAGAKGSPDHPFDGKDIWPTLASGQPSPHDDILINVEAFRGAIRKGNWKLVKIALFPGRTELFDLSKDPGEQHNVADQFPEVVSDLSARLERLCKGNEAELVDRGSTGLLGAQGKTIFDPDFDIDDSGLPHEKAKLRSDANRSDRKYPILRFCWPPRHAGRSIHRQAMSAIAAPTKSTEREPS